MALINKVEEVTGIAISEAYCRIESVLLSRFDVKQKAIVRYYKNQEAYNNKLPAFKELLFEYGYDAINSIDNPYKAAYLHLKTLPEFIDSVDLI